MKKRNKHIGCSLEDFLKEEGVLEETRAVALKQTLAWQVRQAMEKDKETRKPGTGKPGPETRARKPGTVHSNTKSKSPKTRAGTRDSTLKHRPY
jgi:hypothetical protein